MIDIIDGKTGKVLAQKLTQSEAMMWAAKWADEHECDIIDLFYDEGCVIINVKEDK